jgi:dipeptidyl aminopeptidase/acylaminoacyl peptidase
VLSARTRPPLPMTVFSLVAVIVYGAIICRAGRAASVAEAVPIRDLLSVRAFPWQSTIAMSPNGTWVAYTLMANDRRLVGETKWSVYTTSGVPNNVEGSEVWMANTVTHEQRKVSGTASSAWGPAFSPSGRALAFYSDANGEARLWLYDLDRESARAVSDAQVRVASSYEDPVWSPSGDAVYTKLLPEHSGTTEDNPKDFDRQEPFVRVFRSLVGTVSKPEETQEAPVPDDGIYEGDLSEVTVDSGQVTRLLPTLSVRGWWLSPDGWHLAYTAETGIERGNADDRLFTLGVIDLHTRRLHVVGSDLPLVSHGVVVSWSPHGERLAYIAGRPSDLGESQHSAVFVVDKGGSGIPVSVSGSAFVDHPYVFRAPLWDTSGERIVTLDETKLYVYDLASHASQEIPVTPGKTYVEVLSSWHTHRIWSDRGGVLYVVERDSESKALEVVRVYVKSGRREEVASEKQSLNIYPMLQMEAVSDDSPLAYTAQSADSPPNVWLADPGFSRHERLTQTNPELSRYGLGGSRVISWRSVDGAALRGALLLPAGYESGKRYPLIVNVYGDSNLSDHAYEFGLSVGTGPTNAQLFSSRGYAVLEPDSPITTETPSIDLFKDVMPGVDEAIELGIADPQRLALMGTSYGGYSALAILTQTSRFKAGAIISGITDLMSQYTWMDNDGASIWIGWAEETQGHMGGTPWKYRQRYIENSPLWWADRLVTPVLMGCGTEDQPITNQCRAMFVALRRLGKVAEYREYPGGGHLPDKWKLEQQMDFLEALLRWFDKCLGADVSSEQSHHPQAGMH